MFYYNGHGVPKPTSSGEIWVFNKSESICRTKVPDVLMADTVAYTQYIPVSLQDLQDWLGR